MTLQVQSFELPGLAGAADAEHPAPHVLLTASEHCWSRNPVLHRPPNVRTTLCCPEQLLPQYMCIGR